MAIVYMNVMPPFTLILFSMSATGQIKSTALWGNLAKIVNHGKLVIKVFLPCKATLYSCLYVYMIYAKVNQFLSEVQIIHFSLFSLHLNSTTFITHPYFLFYSTSFFHCLIFLFFRSLYS